MEGLCMTDPTIGVSKHDHNTPFEETPKLSPFDPTGLVTDESGHSVTDSEPSTPTNDIDSFEKNGNHDSHDSQVIRPYAIEEPDDEPDATLPRHDLPCLPDRFERWQRDLRDYMTGLNVRPENSNGTKYPVMRKRGQKRKSASIASSIHSHSGSHSFRRRTTSAEPHQQANDYSHKRHRGCSEEPQHHYDTDSFHTFREPKTNESSSSEAPTPDLSSAETMNDSAADEMDID
ncbi:hypothetical protein PENANT_c024G10289 [Penicillium antarcticum]|uniref:Uncharacterized protein n=1 Tax=Penicillium antarcticum TaxID=416450 RepID=A0A1V6PY46_9EURO|nr:uncharacterized protein N7508_005198 [Penicillium antarcticum]KAJ5306183.1 hypothetical protein N7508_005198 [Penicillium antarcticum]OQD81885.1 hypothetical protein PENANT_c024G10289 [Penicillium antarcticum]